MAGKQKGGSWGVVEGLRERAGDGEWEEEKEQQKQVFLEFVIIC